VQVWRSRLEARVAAELPGGLRLVHMHDPTLRQVSLDYGSPEDRVSFADGYPVLLIGAASLEDLNGRLAVKLPMNRFRPNVVVEGSTPYAEDGWRRVRIGEIAFRVVKPCARCVVTTVEQATGTRGDERTEPLRTLATYRKSALGVLFGQNLVPDGTGTVRVGDEVEVLACGIYRAPWKYAPVSARVSGRASGRTSSIRAGTGYFPARCRFRPKMIAAAGMARSAAMT
jgi:uncharacterized protein YcbX